MATILNLGTFLQGLIHIYLCRTETCLIMNLADIICWGRVGDTKQQGRKERTYRTLYLEIHRNTGITIHFKPQPK